MQAPCTNQANNSLKLITKMWLTQPLLYTPISVQVLKIQGTIYHFMSTFSLCQWNESEVWRTWQSNVALLRESWPRIEKKPKHMLFFYIPESSDNTQISLWSTIPLTRLCRVQRDYCPGCVTSCFWRWHPISDQDHQILPPCCKSSSN